MELESQLTKSYFSGVETYHQPENDSYQNPFIVDLPINSMVISHSFLLVYQRVYPMKFH